MSEQLQAIITLVESRDVKERLKGLNVMSDYMKKNKIDDELGTILDTLAGTLKDNNFKVCENALHTLGTCLSQLTDQGQFRPYFNMILPLVIERLGDTKIVVRDTALDTILYIAHICTPKETFAALTPCFGHKNQRVREAILIAFRKTVVQYGPSSAFFKQMLPNVIEMLNDPTKEVRDCAVQCLEIIYKYVGEELKHELHKSKVRPGQLKDIEERLSSITLEADKLISLYKKSQSLNSSPKNVS
jgi:CLIP-associating protein 1/2